MQGAFSVPLGASGAAGARDIYRIFPEGMPLDSYLIPIDSVSANGVSYLDTASLPCPRRPSNDQAEHARPMCSQASGADALAAVAVA